MYPNIKSPRSTGFIDKYVLMAVGGVENVAGGDENNNVEIFDFKTNTSCFGPKFPMAVRHPLADYANHQPLVCGGQIKSSNQYSKECYTLDSADQKWYPLQEMDRYHYMGSHGVLHSGHDLWVLGGN